MDRSQTPLPAMDVEHIDLDRLPAPRQDHGSRRPALGRAVVDAVVVGTDREVTPGPRVSAQLGRVVLYVDGVPQSDEPSAEEPAGQALD